MEDTCTVHPSAAGRILCVHDYLVSFCRILEKKEKTMVVSWPFFVILSFGDHPILVDSGLLRHQCRFLEPQQFVGHAIFVCVCPGNGRSNCYTVGFIFCRVAGSGSGY